MQLTNPDRQPVPQISRGLTRTTLILLLRAALETNEMRFARQTALSWLSLYPGDLEVNVLLAQVFKSEGKNGQSIQILEKVWRLDPEYLEASQLLVKFYTEGDPEPYQRLMTHLYVLGQRPPNGLKIPAWATILRNSRRAYAEGNLESAEMFVHQAMALNPDQILTAITHIEIIRALRDESSLSKFADIYHENFPECVLFKLVLAETKLEAGAESSAVNILHQCVAADASGQVSTRLWGNSHPYKPLWPDRFESGLDIAVPAAVALRMGWNQLPASQGYIDGGGKNNSISQDGKRSLRHKNIKPLKEASKFQRTSFSGSMKSNSNNLRGKSTPKWMTDAEKEMDDLAKRMKISPVGKADGRFPIYVIFSSKRGLVNQYGEQSFGVIDKELQRLATAIRKRANWGAMVFYPDDIETTGKLAMKTTGTNDPWKLKLAITDLDKSLAKKGGRIGAVLIIGGPEVVPFHRLPNPTDDLDDEVLSDNPFATRDSNYFVPEWPVGRFTGENTHDAGMLLQQIRQSVSYHEKASQKPKGMKLAETFQTWLGWLLRPVRILRPSSSFGLTAAVWRRSSLAVYRPVGEGRSLSVSPPISTGFLNGKITGSPLSYYNLHGLADTAEWYGQRDVFDLSVEPEYPVALSMADLPKNGSSPKIVFSEACYGGFTVGKTEQSSIALRFLSLGTQALVGSTCIAYGSVSTPLIGADLLGFLFWSALREGYSVGDALTQAKINLAREMNRRQGFLDGEDQKTLLSFVLYGDPLIYHDGIQVTKKRFVRIKQHIAVRTVSDQQAESITNPPALNERLVKQAKLALEPYLPGWEKAEISINRPELVSQGKIHRGAGGTLGNPISSKQIGDRTVVIFRKNVEIAGRKSFQYARVTMGAGGKLSKMVVSR